MAQHIQNRSGISAAPERAAKMLDGMDEFPPTSTGNGEGVAKIRKEYIKASQPIATIPKTDAINDKLAPFADAMGARLAFERVGVRLYEGLIGKAKAGQRFGGGPSADDLQEICDEERRHFELLRDTLAEMGGDPTAVTPTADIQLTAGKGIGDVIGDPRTNLLQSLEAILVAELADNDSWEGLIEMAQVHGKQALAEQFQRCLDTEREHLEKVRGWVAQGQGRRPTKH